MERLLPPDEKNPPARGLTDGFGHANGSGTVRRGNALSPDKVPGLETSQAIREAVVSAQKSEAGRHNKSGPYERCQKSKAAHDREYIVGRFLGHSAITVFIHADLLFLEITR